MKFVVWDKEKLKNLTIEEKEQWFDVYNNGLEEDRGYQLNDPNIETIKQDIKEDYFKFLHDYTRSEFFRAYFLLYEDTKIVSLCRVHPNVTLYLEGVETHRDYQQKGYATILLEETIKYLKELNYTELRSVVSEHNKASLALHKKLGFEEYDRVDSKVRFEYKIMDKPRYYLNVFSGREFLLGLFFGISYHKDNNNKFYKDAMRDQITNVVFSTVLLNFFYVFTYTRTDVNMHLMNTLIISSIVFVIYTNLLNTIRFIKTNDIKYKEVIRKYLMINIMIIVAVHVLGYYMTVLSEIIWG